MDQNLSKQGTPLSKQGTPAQLNKPRAVEPRPVEKQATTFSKISRIARKKGRTIYYVSRKSKPLFSRGSVAPKIRLRGLRFAVLMVVIMDLQYDFYKILFVFSGPHTPGAVAVVAACSRFIRILSHRRGAFASVATAVGLRLAAPRRWSAKSAGSKRDACVN